MTRNTREQLSRRRRCRFSLRNNFEILEPSSNSHRPHSEHGAVHLERGHRQTPSGTINSDEFRSIHRRRAAYIGSNGLPGSVLLARERLVERLRGVSLPENRQNIGSPSSNNSFVGTNSNLLETRSERLIETTSKHPPGLTRDALNCLLLEVFSNENDEKTTRECTICLEAFQDGDKLIRLHCRHGFHSCCLFPWVHICGACPNCRKPIVVDVKMKG